MGEQGRCWLCLRPVIYGSSCCLHLPRCTDSLIHQPRILFGEEKLISKGKTFWERTALNANRTPDSLGDRCVDANKPSWVFFCLFVCLFSSLHMTAVFQVYDLEKRGNPTDLAPQSLFTVLLVLLCMGRRNSCIRLSVCSRGSCVKSAGQFGWKTTSFKMKNIWWCELRSWQTSVARSLSLHYSGLMQNQLHNIPESVF